MNVRGDGVVPPPRIGAGNLAMRYSRACLVALLLGLSFALGCASAHAASLDEALAHFTADDFSETSAGIGAVALSGDPRAETIIRALQDGRLMFSAESKAVYVKDESGKLTNAATGESIAGDAPADLDNVRINNRLRGAIDAALGGLTLLAGDPGTRFEAAQAVFKSRAANALPTLETALAKEQDPRVKRALAEARAAVILAGDKGSDDEKLAAVDIARQRGDQDALALLSSLPADTSPAVMKAATTTIAAIKNRLALWEAVQDAWYGISLGSVLLLAAIGLAITFGVMGVINMAHGEMVMLGAYVTFVVQDVDPRAQSRACSIIRSPSPFRSRFCVAGLVGILIERSIIRFLYGRPLETLLATWGLSLILQQAVRTVFGPNNREVGNPSWMSGAFELGGITITYNRLWIICFALAVFIALLALLRFTRFGLEMRAVTQNRPMAASMGIRTGRIDALTFGLGSGIAGMAGVALSQIDNVSPNLGQGYIIDSFMVVVFGGVGNLWGTLVGCVRRSASPTSSSSPMPARCSARSRSWCSSSCSSRSGRAACSRSRAGRWKHDDAFARPHPLARPRRRSRS